MSSRSGHSSSRSSSHRDQNDEEANSESDEWLFESIVAFLSTPIWTIPIQHFIEQNCTIFSPTDGWSGGSILDSNDDSKHHVLPEHHEIHAKYKELVDFLIGTFLQDIGVSYNKFIRACKNPNRFKEHPVYLELVEQIWCVDNFELFKSLMVRRNIELELQSLLLLQHQLGLISSTAGLNREKDDDKIMAIIIKKSKDEYDTLMNMSGGERAMRHRGDVTESGVSSGTGRMMINRQEQETALKIARKSDRIIGELKSELSAHDYANQRIIDEQVINKHEMNDAIGKMNQMRIDKHNDDVMDGRGAASASNSRPPLTLADTYLSNIHGHVSNSGVSDGELERRAAFMQKQRDLLTEKKRAERQRQLDKFVHAAEVSGQPSRPMSSRAARSVLAGAEPADLNSVTSVMSEDERKKLEARKALAETLKKEVINTRKY